MCFSATASFTSGVVLIGAGAYLASPHKSNMHQKPLAVIPCIFGFQQIIEGFVWIGFQGLIPEAIHNLSIYMFSFFATSFWPAFIPFAIYQFEKKPSTSITHSNAFIKNFYSFWLYH